MRTQQFLDFKAKYNDFKYGQLTSTQSSKILTKEITKHINIVEAHLKNPECFNKYTTGIFLKEQTFIVSSWRITEMPNARERSVLVDFIAFLIKFEHPVYVSEESGLQPIESVFSIERALTRIKPINTKTAIHMAEQIGLPEKTICVLNTSFLEDLLTDTLVTKSVGIDIEDAVFSASKIANLSNCLDPEDQFARIILDTPTLDPEPQIKRLTIYIDNNLPDERIYRIHECYPNLTRITIQGYRHQNDGNLRYKQLVELLSHYPQLSQLTFIRIKMADLVCNEFPKALNNLTELSIVFSQFHTAFINSMLLNNPNLKRLNADHPPLECDRNMAGELFSSLPPNHFPCLEHLSLYHEQPEHTITRRIFLAAPQLKSVTFNGIGIPNLDLSAIPNNALISKLSLKHIACPISILSLLQNFPNLTCLERIGEPFLWFFYPSTQSLSLLKQLKELTLSSTTTPISMNELQNFLTYCDHLSHLEIQSSQYKSPPVAIEPISLPSLQSVYLPYLDSSNAWILQSAPNLTHLQVIQVISKTEHSSLPLLMEALEKMPKLEKLTIRTTFDSNDLEIKFSSDSFHLPKLYRLEIEKNLNHSNLILPEKFASHYLFDHKKLLEIFPHISTLITDYLSVNPTSPILEKTSLTTLHTNALQIVFDTALYTPHLHSVHLTLNNGSRIFASTQPIHQVQELFLDISIEESRDNPAQMNIILSSFPNITRLSITNSTETPFYLYSKYPDFVLTFPKMLRRIDFHKIAIDLIQLKNIITPELNSISLNMHDARGLTDQEMNNLKQAYPYIHFQTSGSRTRKKNLEDYRFDSEGDEEEEVKHYAPPVVQPLHSPSSLKTSTRFSADPDEMLFSEKYFYRQFGFTNQPEPLNSMECHAVYQYIPDLDPMSPWQPYQPKDDELEPCNPFVSPQLPLPVEQDDCQYFGLKQFKEIRSGNWIQLPVPHVNPINHLHVVWNDLNLPLDIRKHKRSGIFYFRVHTNDEITITIAFSMLSFPLAPSIQHQEPTETIKPIFKLISELNFEASGHLEKNNAYQQLLNIDQRLLSIALFEFCDFPESPEMTQSSKYKVELNHDALNHLIKTRPLNCPCLARAQLFTAIRTELNIPDTFLNTNFIHAFSMASVNTNNFTPLHLGGAPTNRIYVKDSLLFSVQKHLQRLEENIKEIKQRMLLETLPPNNRFQTWKTDVPKPENMESLIELIFSNRFKNQVVVVNESACVETLHDQVCRLKRTGKYQCFFSPHLDTLSLQTRVIEEGTSHQTDSELALFLKQTTDEPLFWFINWCHPTPHHGALETIFDRNTPRFQDFPIQKNVCIVAAMDVTAFKSLKLNHLQSSLRKKMDVILHAPFIGKLPAVKLESLPIRDHDVVIIREQEWEKECVGYPKLVDGKLKMHYRKLTTMPTSPSLVLHYPAVNQFDFRWFMREILDENNKVQSFYFNGKKWNFTNAYTVVFSGAVVLWNVPRDGMTMAPLKSAVSRDIPENDGSTLVLNHQTFSSFFKHYKLISTRIEKSEGLFERYSKQTLSLHTTSELTSGEHYGIEQQAKKFGIAYHVKNSTEKLRTHDPERISVTVTNDMIYSLHKLMQSEADAPEIIPIEPETGFFSLLLGVKQTEIDQKKELLALETYLFLLIKTGKSVVFVGHFSQAFVQNIETLFTPKPYLFFNGELLFVSGKIRFITEDALPFSGIEYTKDHYDAQRDIEKIKEPLKEKLKKTYESLNIVPLYSHFMDYPKDASFTAIESWCNELITGLELSRGVFSSRTSMPVTTAGTMLFATEPLSFLKKLSEQKIISLISESGAGKSYFVQHLHEHEPTVRVFHGLLTLDNYLNQKENTPVLFNDEINIDNNPYRYCVFLNLLLGQNYIWRYGSKIDLSNRTIVNALNPGHYNKNRQEPDMLRRFPKQYMQFIPKPTNEIIYPLLPAFQNREKPLELIGYYYNKAIELKLPVSLRNAENICLTAHRLRTFFKENIPDSILALYAILFELNTLTFDRSLTKSLRMELKNTLEWKKSGKNIKMCFLSQIEKYIKENDKTNYFWIRRDKKIALTLWIMFNVRVIKMRENSPFKQHHGISAFILEGTDDAGTPDLFNALLNIFPLNVVEMISDDPEKMNACFHHGGKLVKRHYNRGLDEKQHNNVLSGVDQEQKPPRKIGFFMMAVQEPITVCNADMLSAAQINRAVTVRVREYKPKDLMEKAQKQCQLNAQESIALVSEFNAAVQYSEHHSLFPPPNVKDLMREGEKVKKVCM